MPEQRVGSFTSDFEAAMADTDSKLWRLEKQFWLGGADVYEQYLADSSVMVFAGMVLTKLQTVDAIASGSRWTSVSFTDQRVVRLTPDAVALIYRASGSRERQQAPYSALVSSVYVRDDEDWKLALHQQSPENRPT
jgi:hypothetical protein